MVCPLYPAHLIFLYFFALITLWILCCGAAVVTANKLDRLNVTFYPEDVQKLVEGESREVFVSIPPIPDTDEVFLELYSENPHIAMVSKNTSIYLKKSEMGSYWTNNLSFALTGEFLGYTNVMVRAKVFSKPDSQNKGAVEEKVLESKPLPVSVVRKYRVIDTVFVASIAIMVGLNYINMGSSLDMDVVMNTIKKPIAPFVGFCSQFLFMPLISFALSFIIFCDPAMRLGLFTIGCSPGGGASNMWTYLLGGNLNLSITMTFISNVLAFVMMPLWLFSLGRVIFSSNNITVPYTNITSYLILMVIPVGIGLLIQRYAPRVTKFCRKILGPFSVFMIIFIIVFGTYTNLYMFSLFSWQVVVAGMAVPWLGYLFGALISRALRFPTPDIIAVAIETGIQNSGIAIVLLRISLPQPEADLTSVIPVAMATMMPIPLTIAMCVIRLHKYFEEKGGKRYEIAATNGVEKVPYDAEVGVKDNNNALNQAFIPRSDTCESNLS